MTRAVLLMLVAMTLIPSGDAAAKLLTGTHQVTPIWAAWIRFVIGTAVVLPLTPISAWRFLADWRVILRASLITGGICCILMGLAREPMANVFGAFFIGPILTYVLSALLLGEKISFGRSVLLLIGFGGVLLVVKPGFGMTPGLIWAVVAGLFYGSYLTATRWLANDVPAKALLFSQLFIAMIITTPFAVLNSPTITFEIAGLSALSGLFSMFGNLLLLFALRLQPGTRMAPFVYFQLVAATALGWLVFSTLPDTLTWIGLAILITSGFCSLLLADRR
ncbi:DMT family transporter [Algirhabdus cladophorae]|uniref:DMT family transporter n=1 Tax=Algirhabdus cladophorae TaxID=3377108 RepID=UPI003B849434